jgi:uncharacterized protein with gpF-like domain
MKSAYDLAMERLEKKAPTQSLTTDQKKEIADIEERATAKEAEQRVFITGKIAEAKMAGDYAKVAEHEAQLARELARIRENCEAEKGKIWNG